jgi:hypothetical protein
VGQFGFECCPLVQEISPVIHYLPCFGGGISLSLFTEISALGVYIFAVPLFSGAGCVPPAPSTVHILSQFFSFVGQFGFGCCSLAQENSFVVHYLPCFGKWLIVHLLLVLTAFTLFVY